MARPGITYNQVVGAANTIIEDGKNPTIQRVRAVLGTGSPNTIHRHLKTYRETEGVQELKQPELPVELQTAIVKAMEQHAGAAVAELKNELIQSQAEAAELSTAGAQLEAEMKEVVESSQALSDEYQRLAAVADERAREIEQLKIDISRERESAEKARLKLAQAQNTSEIKDARIKELISEIEKRRFERDQAVEAKAGAEKAAAVAVARLDAANERLEDRGITHDLKHRQTDESTHKDLQEYFQRDIDAEVQAEREKSARRYISSLIERGHTYASAAKKLNGDAYPTIDGKSLWTWQAVKKYSQ